jgi:putative iron-dependent peroxidase
MILPTAAATGQIGASDRDGPGDGSALGEDMRVSTDASARDVAPALVAGLAEAAQTAEAAESAEPAEPQAVVTPLTKAAIFLVAVINPGDAAEDGARSLCADLSALVRAVGFRDLAGYLSCVTGISATAWDRLTGLPRPAGLHPFRELRAGSRHAIATPGDLLFHIRAARMDLCFELALQIRSRLADVGEVVDEVHGFSYFDERDLLGFVDGTENPTGPAAARAAIIGPEEPAYEGGSYVIVQKYVHDLDGWNALPVEQQEKIIGRTKLADIELDDAVKPTSAHNALTTIVVDGEEVDIVRDNMPFGQIGTGEFGTYFIGYARSAATTEQMLHNMFIGSPPGNYDRILDFSTAVTGTLFFVPSQSMLDGFDDLGAGHAGDSVQDAQVPSQAQAGDGSLNIGSLRGDA